MTERKDFQQAAYNSYEHDYSEWPDAKLLEEKAYITDRLSGKEILTGHQTIKRFLGELSRVAFELNMRESERSGEPVVAHFDPEAYDWAAPNETESDSVAA